jgi:hypothetical protein
MANRMRTEISTYLLHRQQLQQPLLHRSVIGPQARLGNLGEIATNYMRGEALRQSILGPQVRLGDVEAISSNYPRDQFFGKPAEIVKSVIGPQVRLGEAEAIATNYPRK